MGLILLVVGAKVLVQSASVLALLSNISPFVVGLTIVAMGTSAPELFVSISANIQNLGPLVFGNLIGSNIINISLVLGISAIILPVPVRQKTSLIEWGLMFSSTLVVMGLLWNLEVSKREGILLVFLMIVFVLLFFWRGREGLDVQDESVLDELKELKMKIEASNHFRVIFKNIFLLFTGFVCLYFGSEFFVKGAVYLAEIWRISERVIGLTVVAFGTGLPELATVVAASYKRKSDLGIGTLLGSNLFNLVGILGLCALLKPLQASRHSLMYDLPWLLGISAFLLIPLVSRKPIGRLMGIIFLMIYSIYAVSLFYVV